MNKKLFGVSFAQKKYDLALKYCQPAADQGDPEAQYYLGLMYEMGFGLKQDYFKAFEWRGKAAENGNADAQCCLGGLYIKGHGVKQDLDNAIKWFEKAAEQGHAEATEFLADINSMLNG